MREGRKVVNLSLHLNPKSLLLEGREVVDLGVNLRSTCQLSVLGGGLKGKKWPPNGSPWLHMSA